MQPRAKFKRRCTLYNDYALTGAFLSRVVVVYDVPVRASSYVRRAASLLLAF